MAVGRISGPLLKSNLLRNGIDLAFETDLLYLDVNNQRIGIKTDQPTHELQINGTARATNLLVDTQAEIADITITGNTISSASSLNLLTTGSDTVVYQRQLDVQSLSIYDNVIETNESNANLELRPNGTGQVDVFSDMNVTGNIHATGNITADGDIQLGSTDQTSPNDDTVTFNAEIASDLIPDVDNTYQLGTSAKRWSDIWVNTFTAENIDTGDLFVDGIDLSLRQGNIVYVSTNGDDTNTGTHPNDAVGSLEYALSITTAGDSIHIYPGTYTENFPLTIPVGVGIKGESLRSVTIQPTTATRYNDAFLMNGETTIEDITVSGFYSGGNYFEITANGTGSMTMNVGTAPFAHTYVSGGTVSAVGVTNATITNATYNHTTGELVITHTGGTTTNGTSAFISGLTFSCNNDTRVFPDNGYAFRFATDFETTSRSPYIKNITVITEGSVTSANDPRGFNQGDAGKGVYIDGAYATANSKEAAMLFHSVTFICPGVDAVTATNGARIEWLNSFTYFANRSIYAFDSNDGIKGDGKTALRVDDVVGTYSAGETVTYYDTDGTTVLATGTIETVDADGKIYIDAKNLGWELPSQRAGKTVVVSGDAQITSAVSKFGIGSLELDGTGDYISIASNDDFGFGTGDWTVEGYFYPTTSGDSRCLMDFRASTSPDDAVFMGINISNKPYFMVGGVAEIVAATSVTQNAWNHVAIVKNSGTTTLYLNGVSEGTYTDSVDYGTAKPLIIGDTYAHTAEFTGRVDEIRVVKGEAKYTAAFTPDVRPFVSEENTVLLLHFDDIDGSTTIVDDGITGQDIRFSGSATARKTTLVDHSDFGAEIRLIGSASVYGNFGLVGDGPGVIMYAIGHNVAYIGNGGSVDNDNTTIIQANEVVETDNARIYFSTVDQNGDFRVGDLFFIDQENGAIQFSNASFNIDTTNGIEITDGTNTTLIKGDKIETGNWRLSGNTLETLAGDANITAASGQINLQDNVDITGNLDVVGNVSIAGNVTIGDQNTDSISFAANIDSGMFPTTTDTYDLGSASLRWKDLHTNRLYIDSIEINDNYIQTIDSNADLELRANGTGEVIVPSNDVTITQDLTVQGTTIVQDLTVNSELTVNDNVNITGDVSVTGNVSLTETLTVDGAGQFEDIRVEGNVVTTTLSNSDLELRASGTGIVFIPNNDVTINNNLDVTGDITASNLTLSTEINSPLFTTGDINISTNTITTTLSNSDLELRANATGDILVPTNDVFLSQDLTVNGTTNLKDTNITGDILHTGNVTQTGDVTQTGNVTLTGDMTVTASAQFEDINITGNVVSTTLSNSDLELRANGTGEILIPNNDVQINNNLSVQSLDTDNLSVTNTITSSSYTTGDINISTNIVTTTLSNSNLELRANATGEILVPSNDVVMSQDLTVNGLSTLSNTNINGTLTHVGNTTQTGNLTQTGDIGLTGTLSVSSDAQFEDIRIAGNIISTTLSNSNLELNANGTGNIVIPNNDLEINNNLSISNNIQTDTLTVTNNVDAATFSTGDISINGNTVTTTLSNSDLELRASGVGEILVPSNDVLMSQDLTVNGLTTLANTNITGTVTHTGNTTQTGNLNQTGEINVTGTLSVSSDLQFEDINIAGNVITTTLSNSDLELRANGVGEILIPNNNVTINNSLDVLGSINTGSLTSNTSVSAASFTTGDIVISGNLIETTLSNSDLALRANSGTILVDINDVQIDQNLTVSGITTLATTNITGTLTHTGNTTQTGDINLTGNLSVSGLIDVASAVQLEEILIDDNVITTTTSNVDLELRASGTGIVLVPNNDVVIENTATVNGQVTTQDIINSGTVTSPILTNGDINIAGNVIETTTSNSDLELRASGTGIVNIPNNNVSITNDLTVGGLTTLANTVINGTLTQTGNYTLTGDAVINGNYTVTGLFDINSEMQFENILINDNFITTTDSNSNLELRASGTGGILIPSNSVNILTNLNVAGVTNTDDIVNTGTIESNTINTDDINITGNTISVTSANTDLLFNANGTGVVRFQNSDVNFNSNLDVLGTTTLATTNITGTLTQTGDTNQTGNLTVSNDITVTGELSVTNSAQFEDVKIEQNFITTTLSNSNLDLEANGIGIISVPNNDVELAKDLTVLGTITSGAIINTGTITSDNFTTGDIWIDDNTITTTLSNSNLELRANGTGIIQIPNNDVEITNNLTVNSLTTTGNVDIVGDVTQTGNVTQTGDFSLTGNLDVSNNLTVGSFAQFSDVRIETNFITTTLSNSDLELRASGTGKVLIPSNDVEVTGNISVIGVTTLGTVNNTGTITSGEFSTGDISITGNSIETTQAGSDLELSAVAGSGISIPNNDVSITNDLSVTGTTTLSTTNITGTVTHTGNYVQTGNTTIDGDVYVSGNINLESTFQFEEININDNIITTTSSNADLDLRANAAGEIVVPLNDVRFSQDLFVEGDLVTNNLISTSSLITSNQITTGDILIQDNFITTTASNSNLELRAAGTGSIDLGIIDINQNNINVATGNDLQFNISSGSNVVFDSTESIVLPKGTTLERPAAPVAGMIRFNTDISDYEGYDGTNWKRLGGVYDLDEDTKITAELTTGANDGVIRFYSNGTLVSTLDSVGLTTPKIEIDNIVIENSTIGTLTPNTSITLEANGTGTVNLENFAINESTITNTLNGSNMTIVQSGTGYLKFGDTEGFVIPVGTNTQRPAVPEIGVTRFNTDSSRVEIYDGQNWVSVAGSQSGISRTEAEDLALEIVLSLG